MSFGTFGHDARAYDAHLRDAWADLIRKHFQSYEHAAVFFGVSEKTVRNWAEGTCGPKGAAVGWAIKSLPGAAEKLLGA